MFAKECDGSMKEYEDASLGFAGRKKGVCHQSACRNHQLPTTAVFSFDLFTPCELVTSMS